MSFKELNFDSDNDGIADSYVESADTNMDGVFDVHTQYSDTDGDGTLDSVLSLSDENHDGLFETQMMENDYNNDGIADYVSQSTFVDEDGDGIVDTMIFQQDLNGDGIFDAISLQIDPGNTEQFNLQPDSNEMSDNGSGVDTVGYDNADSDDSGYAMDLEPTVYGEPQEDMQNWHLQETDSSCAVCSQEFVLEELTGQNHTEAELRDLAESQGWYDENGTTMDNVGNILDYYGLDVNRHEGGSIDDIANCLDNGGKVIVGLDSDEIWYGPETYDPGDDADHAVEVIGIDNSDPDNPMVILNDSGTPDGQGSMIPLDRFMDAWQDSNCYMVEAYAN